MSKVSKILLFILVSIFISEAFHNHSLAVFNPRYHWRTFTRLDGLAGNNVRAILQHSSGEIWFATSAGVSRFNELWQRYTKAEGLADNNVIGMVEANDGSLWFATQNGLSVTVVNPDLPFEPLSFRSFYQNDGLLDNQITAIAPDNDGNIWVGTPLGASEFNGESWENHQEEKGLLFRGVTAILAASRSQEMWFGIRASSTEFSAISRFDGESWTVFTIDDGIPIGNIHDILEDGLGNIWLATSNGIARFDGASWDTFTVADGLVGNNVHTIMLDNQKRLWFGTNSGVSVIDVVSSLAPQPFEHSWQITVGDNIQAILEDNNGRIWLGTSSRGVNFSDRSWQVFTVESGLSDNFITTITEDKIGNLWLGTLNGLCRLDMKLIHSQEQGLQINDGECEIFTMADGLPSNEIRSLTVDKTGNVWAGTGRGIGVFDGVGFYQYTQKDGLSSNSVHTVTMDSAGNIWASTGVSIGEIDPFEQFAGLSKFGGTNWFRIPDVDAIASALFEDNGGNIWLGTFHDGIRILSNGGMQRFTTIEGLASNAISSIIEDAAGRIWVGTANGINILWRGTTAGKGIDSQQYEWLHLTTDDGLIDNRVQSLFRSSTGEIWVGTASGANTIRFDSQDTMLGFQQWTTFTVNDGLASNNIGTIFESSDGSVWFTSNDGSGLTRYVREKIAPRTRITNGPRGIIGTQSVTFEYEGGDASTPKSELSYSYRIGLEDWSPFTKRTSVTISNLEDKTDYEFAVRAKDKYGNIDFWGDRARFHVDAELPFVRITNPTDNQVIGRVYNIIGSATDKTDFKKYKIQTPDFVHESSDPVEDGILTSWDTRNLSEDGKYTILLTAWDKEEGQYDIEHHNSYKVSVIVDNTKPKVEIISPEPGIHSGKIEIVAFLEDIHLDSYTLKYTQSKGTGAKQIRFSHFSGEELRYPWDSSNIYGETTLILEVQDKAGNKNTAEVTINLDNRTAPPDTQITYPTAGQVISQEINIIGIADDSTLSEFTLEYFPKDKPTEYEIIKHSTSPVKENDILAAWNTTDVPDGNYILRLWARDDNGYENDATVPIIVDNTPPIASIEAPIDGEILSSNSRTLISGTVMDDNFDRYTLKYTQNLGEPEDQIINSDEPPKDSPLSPFQRGAGGLLKGGRGLLGSWNTSGLDGEYFLTLTVWDKAGLENSHSITIILDDLLPSVQISFPKQGEIISNIVEIIGTAKDDNFDYYELSFQKENDGNNWQKIPLDQTAQSTTKENSLLAIWNTLAGTEPLNGDYIILLAAFDKSGHKNSEERRIVIDNKPPEASISQPVNFQQVSQEVQIIGTSDDENFSEYIIEFGPGESPQKWDSVSETPFLKEVRANLLTKWNTQNKSGKYTIRLTVIDKVQHQSEARVILNLKEPIFRSIGGEITDNNSNAQILIPPNSLDIESISTVVTINPVQNINVYPAPSGFTHTGIAYDFEPKEVQFKNIKPATIVVYYADSINLSGDDNPLTPFIPLNNPLAPFIKGEEGAQGGYKGDEKLALLFWHDKIGAFQLIGGTMDKSKGTISAPINKLGRYALMQMNTIPNNNNDASLSNLACQPRVFHPKRGESTRISFRLSQPSDVTVKIYNLAGRLKRILQKQQLMTKEWQTVVWEGKDEDHRIVPGGPYIVTVTTAGKSIQKTVFVWND